MEGLQDLVKAAKEGVSVGVKTGGDLQQELTYANHRSVLKYKGEVLRKAMSDVTMGQAMVFKVDYVFRL